jgi:DNA-binding transcriptional MerR regulator
MGGALRAPANVGLPGPTVNAPVAAGVAVHRANLRPPGPVIERTYEIHEVASLTGLSPARLRAWERRYQAVRPRRQPNGYRAYSAEQVALLRAFARLTRAGERIGDLASRPAREVVSRAEAREQEDPAQGTLVAALRAFDRERLEALVAQQLALRGLGAFAQETVLPLARSVGDLWARGELAVGAEHIATEVIVHALKAGLRMGRVAGPLAVAACLPGERHEWGLLSALAVMQDGGYRVDYLGPDLPLEDATQAAWGLRARAVALSGSAAAAVNAMLPALARLPERLPPHTLPVIGGAGAEAHADPLRSYGFRVGLEEWLARAPS